MTNSLQHRRFRFKLRTLLVFVSLVGCWLGWNLSYVREREAVLTKAYSVCSENAWRVKGDVPLAWRLLGAEPVWWVTIPYDVSDQELARVRSLFPEAVEVICIAASE